MRPPPRSTLFPYTTLFRSDHTGNVNALMDACPNATLVLNWFMTERMGESLAVPPSDRKSTRLNSSHLVISYAVFCLKKKKTEQTQDKQYKCMTPEHKNTTR